MKDFQPGTTDKYWYYSSSWESRTDPGHVQGESFLWLGRIRYVANLKSDLKANLSRMSVRFLSSLILFVCLCKKRFNIWNVVVASLVWLTSARQINVSNSKAAWHNASSNSGENRTSSLRRHLTISAVSVDIALSFSSNPKYSLEINDFQVVKAYTVYSE